MGFDLKWNHKEISLVGYSLAGITTTVAFPLADICFDVGQGFDFQIPFAFIALTHGHLDHAGGIPYLLGQKAMRTPITTTVFMPETLVEPMTEIMKIWSRIEEHEYKFNFQGLKAGDQVPLKGDYYLKPFPTYHRVPSLGYTVFKKKKRLKAEYTGMDHMELGNLRRQGITIDERYEEAMVSFTGDTKIEVLQSEQACLSRVLLLEATYWDAKKPVENAREWGHTHLDEILEHLNEFKGEKLVLIHSSVRYSTAELRAILNQRLPDEFKSKVEIFPRPN